MVFTGISKVFRWFYSGFYTDILVEKIANPKLVAESVQMTELSDGTMG